MDMPLLSTVLVKVAATTLNGLTSTFEFSIDLSQILSNYYSSFAFNNNVSIQTKNLCIENSKIILLNQAARFDCFEQKQFQLKVNSKSVTQLLP